MGKCLVVGGGGREHALAWALARSAAVETVFVMPGNPGMVDDGKIVVCDTAASFLNIQNIVTESDIDLVVIGPEVPLVDGLVDQLQEVGILAFGPGKAAALLEGSKVFSKDFMRRYDIPTAAFNTFDNYDEALAYICAIDCSKGVVLKADTLAAGKGVVVTDSFDQAKQTLYDFMCNAECSVKTKSILIEELLTGREVSAFAICDGTNFRVLGYAGDYKRVFDNNLGPNTGGMGAISLQDYPSAAVKEDIIHNVFKKTIDGMQTDGTPFKGVLFAGLMIDDELASVNVIEFNVRFGDPETQVLLPLVDEDFYELLKNAASGGFANDDGHQVALKKAVAMHIVMASKGYPSISAKSPMLLNQNIAYKADETIQNEQQLIFFSGVKKNASGKLVNTGGRVLGVTMLADDLDTAREKSYAFIDKLQFKGSHYRRDIGVIYS